MNNDLFKKVFNQKKIKDNDPLNIYVFSNSYFPIFKDELKKNLDLFGVKKTKITISYNNNIQLELIKFINNKNNLNSTIILYLDPRSFLDDFNWKYFEKIYELILSNKKLINYFFSNVFDKALLRNLGIEKNLSKNIIKKQIAFFKLNKINILNFEHISSGEGTNIFYDNRMWSNGRLPVSLDFSKIFVFNIIYQVLNKIRTQFKVLVFDLDNTLWGGVIGDDGFENIHYSKEDNIGFPYYLIHRILLTLRDRGYLLCICSKNNEKLIEKFFNKNLLPIRYDNFIQKFINWEFKSYNLKLISKNLNINTDQFIFFDDNELEREAVRINFKNKILVPNFENADDLIELLNCFLMIDNFENISKEDRKRSIYLKNTITFNQMKNMNDNYDNYLISLKQNLLIEKVQKKNENRFKQLFERTNQFNFNKKLNINDILEKEIYEKYIISLRDNLGDYGYIATLIIKKNDKSLEITNITLSCRVFQRKIEYAIIEKIILLKKFTNIEKLIGIFEKNEKNNNFKNFYLNLKFKKLSTNKFEIKKNYFNQKHTKYFNKIELLN